MRMVEAPVFILVETFRPETADMQLFVWPRVHAEHAEGRYGLVMFGETRKKLFFFFLDAGPIAGVAALMVEFHPRAQKLRIEIERGPISFNRFGDLALGFEHGAEV